MRPMEADCRRSQMFLFLIIGALAAAPSFGDEEMVRLIDARIASNASEAAHYVVICARPAELTLEEVETKKLPVASPGHVWILFSKEDLKLRACVMEKSYGFWPDGQAKLITDVPGQLVDELTNSSDRKDQLKMTHRVILRVTESQYLAALAVASEWNKKPPKYNTLAMNCTHFSMAILDALSLSIPYRKAELTTDYLERATSELDRKYGPAR